MAKLTAPVLSFGGSGTIGKTVTYASWRGIKYARQRVVPANPNTLAQQTVRKTFALLREMWKIAPDALKAPWDAFAQGRPFLGVNKFVGENVRVLNNEVDMANFIASPGARGGLPPASFTFVAGGGSGEIDATVVPPAPPSGWLVASVTAIAFLDQNPSGFFEGTITAMSDAATPFEFTFSGLDGGEDYLVAAWIVWTKPDGQAAYSVSVSQIVTATA